MRTVIIRRGEEGFSLIELAVAIVLTTIMMLASLPALTRYLQTHQMVGAVNNMAADLRLCRSRAAAEGNDIVFTWSVANKTYTVLDDDNGNGSADVGEAVIGPRDLPDSVTLTNGPDTPFVGTSVTFQSDGSASQSGQFTIADTHGFSQEIQVVRVSGLVKVI